MQSNWFEEQGKAWRASLELLHSSGWSAELTSSAIPLVIEGRLPGGVAFAFYAKDDSAELGVGGPDPGDIPEWAVSENFAAAGWISPEQGMPLIQRLYERYLKEYPGSGNA